MTDAINPNHYKTSGIETIEVTQLFDFCLGNFIKYVWRAGHKRNAEEDLNKALWYLARGIATNSYTRVTEGAVREFRQLVSGDASFTGSRLKDEIILLAVTLLTSESNAQGSVENVQNLIANLKTELSESS